MAEDFPRYRNEDSDDDVPAVRSRERELPVPVTPLVRRAETAEAPAPAQQEGTIFSRDVIAPNLSRPLFDFIRKQEQPGAKAEMPEPLTPPGAEHLPSVSVPGEPEVRTYQPPSEAEIAQAVREASVEDDDDDESPAGDRQASGSAASAATASQAPETPAAEQPRPLNEQFEEIMRAEMGEDYARVTSGEHLDEVEPADEAAADEPAAFATPPATVPAAPAAPSEAFYYTEDDPDASTPLTSGSSTVTPVSSATPSTGTGGTLPPLPPHGGGGGGGGGGGSYFNNAPAAAPNLAPAAVAAANPLEMFTNPSRQEKPHKGRYFVAGFLTGWVIKSHLANKKLRATQEAHDKSMAAQTERTEALQYDQYHTQQHLKRTEAQLQETQAAQAKAQAETRTAEQASAAAGVAAQEAAPAAEHLTREPFTAAQMAEHARPAAAAPSMETPLQYAPQHSAEMPFAAAAGTGAGMAAAGERPANKVFTGEAAPVAAQAEQRPLTAAEAAQQAVEKAYELQQGDHIEHATGGGHNIIVDKHGHAVEGAMNYGEEFKFQQRQEQMRSDLFMATDNSNQAAAKAAQQPGGIQGASVPGQPTPFNQPAYPVQQGQQPTGYGSYSSGIVTGLGSGQAPADHTLPTGQLPPAARQHLLSGKRSPLAATLSSPWLWAAGMVLVLAFFVAALV